MSAEGLLTTGAVSTPAPPPNTQDHPNVSVDLQDSVPVQQRAPAYDPAAALGNIFEGMTVGGTAGSVAGTSVPTGKNSAIMPGASSTSSPEEPVPEVTRKAESAAGLTQNEPAGWSVAAETPAAVVSLFAIPPYAPSLAAQLVDTLTAANGPPGSAFSGSSGQSSRGLTASVSNHAVDGAVLPASANATVSWDGGGDAVSWSDKLNWSGETLPGPLDDVIIDVLGDVTVTLSSGGTSINSLQSTETIVFSEGSLTMTASSSVNQLQWNGGGTLSAPGGLTVLGTMTVANGNDRTFSGVLNNEGTIVQSDHRLFLEDGAVINNQAGAVYEMRSGQMIYSGGGPETRNFNNRGTFRKTTGNTADVYAVMNNQSVVEVVEGALRFFGGGQNEGGTFSALAQANLQFPTGTQSLSGTTRFTGAGLIYLNGAALVVASGGEARLEVEGGLYFIAGSLGGPGRVTNLAPTYWQAGVLDASGGFTNQDLFTSNGGSDRTLIGTFTNQARVVESDHRLFMADGAVINNEAAAVYEFQSGQLIYSGGGPETRNFNNRGIFRKTTTNTGDVYVSMNNQSVVEAVEGALRFFGGGQNEGGTFTALAQANIQFPAGTQS